MRPIRKTIKWGGAVATVLLVVVCIGSGWWTMLWEERKRVRLRDLNWRSAFGRDRSMSSHRHAVPFLLYRPYFDLDW